MSKLNAQGLKMIAEGLLLLAQSIESSDNEKVEAAPAVKKVTKTVETKEEKKAEATESGSYTAEQLEEMSYNDIKKLAKSLGISAVGNRTALVNAILGVSEDSEEEPEAEDKDVEEITTDESDDSEDDSEDDDDDDEETDEDDEDDISAQVESAVADMSDDEIRELLADAELSTKGKRQALIARLVEAVEEGVIEFGDDEESDEETDEEPDESEDSTDEDDADVTKDMTKERRAAYDQVCKDTESSFESGDITREDLIEFINDFNGTSEKFKRVTSMELLENYLTIAANLISDDGEVSEEPGLYYINDEPHCCGHPASFNKKKNAYVCTVCGATYKA